MPAIPRLPKRLLSALPLLVLMVMSAGLVALIPPQPASAGHLCGGTGSPYGPFDLQTYEDANHKTTYARTLELAGLNQLLPDRPTFNLHALEVGPREAGSGQLAAPYIPPVLLKAIAWIESGWNQAAGSVQYGQVGPVLASHDCGYGLMQVTSGMQNVSGVPSLDQAMIGGHYAFNIARGARILAEKWNNAPEFRPIVGDRNPYVIENWYYALWAYNGFAFKNHPMNPQYDPNRPAYRCDGSQPRSAYPYQELIIGCVNHPPSRSGTQLWSPQPASQPNLSHPGVATPGAPLDPAHWEACSQRLQCAPMDMPTPGPPHTDPTGPAAPREAVIGVPSISVSTGGIALAAVPGAESQPVNVTIANSGSGVLGWRATASASWLKMWRAQGVSLGPDLGSVSHTIRVYADTGGLPPGNYSGHLTIESLYASGAPAIIPVTLQVDLKAGATISSDFTGDGLSDIVFLCCSDYASLWLNQGGDNFGVRVFRPWPGYGMQAGLWQSGDFNGDGRSDLAHLCCGDYGNLWLSNGDGTFRLQTFRPWPGYGLQSGSWMTGDFNGDSRTDLLHLCCGDYANVWFSNPNGTFAVYAARPWPGYGAQGGTWQTADVNGDRKTDLVHLCCNDFVNTWLSNGDGSFAISAFGAWPGYGLQSGFWIAGNLNNDGKTDLLHFCCGDYVNSWLSTGDGRFAVVAFNPWPGYQLFSGSVQAGDLNGDGTMDILHQCCPDYVHSWLSTGDGRFSLGAFNPWPGYPIRMGFWQPGQFNGDGKMDLLHVCCQYAHIWRSTGRGDFTIGTFVP